MTGKTPTFKFTRDTDTLDGANAFARQGKSAILHEGSEVSDHTSRENIAGGGHRHERWDVTRAAHRRRWRG